MNIDTLLHAINLDLSRQILDNRSAMFSPKEQRNIELKALEQALLEAKVFGVELEPLLPVVDTRWPFVLTEADRVFLKIQRIDPD